MFTQKQKRMFLHHSSRDYIWKNTYKKILATSILFLCRAVGSSFMVGDWVKMSAVMVGWRRKIWLKQSPKKRNLDQNINYSKTHIWNSFFFFFEDIISGLGIQLFYIHPHASMAITRVFFQFFWFSSRKSRNQQKLAKKFYSFYNTVLLKKYHSFYERQLTWH